MAAINPAYQNYKIARLTERDRASIKAASAAAGTLWDKLNFSGFKDPSTRQSIINLIDPQSCRYAANYLITSLRLANDLSDMDLPIKAGCYISREYSGFVKNLALHRIASTGSVRELMGIDSWQFFSTDNLKKTYLAMKGK